MSSLARGGTLVTVGGTTGFEVALNLLPVFADQLTITGSIMGTLEDMENMVRLIARARIEPEIGVILPMERAESTAKFDLSLLMHSSNTGISGTCCRLQTSRWCRRSSPRRSEWSRPRPPPPGRPRSSPGTRDSRRLRPDWKRSIPSVSAT